VPVFVGHAEAVSVEFERPLNPDAARRILKNAPGVLVVDTLDPEDGFITPIDCAGEDAVYVSRIRRDPSIPNGLMLWIVADNVRKGAALNSVQIAEALLPMLRK
jgi:aspartate-semialdehyde dehydrogenase